MGFLPAMRAHFPHHVELLFPHILGIQDSILKKFHNSSSRMIY